MSKQCPNCAFILADNFKFCPQCAQKTNLHRLSLHEVLHDGLHYFTHADKGLLRLLKDLLIKTGVVAKEYVAGKRKKYFPPLNFFLIVATVYVLIMSMASSRPPGNVLRDHPELNRISDPVQKERVRQIYARQSKAIYFLNKYSNMVAMVAVPLICFIYWLFYIRHRYNYTEHLIGCMYMAGFTNLIYVVGLVPLLLLINMKDSNEIIIVLMLFKLIYNSIFYYHFIGKGTKSSAVKAVGVSLFTVLFWIILSAGLVRMYITNGFWGFLS